MLESQAIGIPMMYSISIKNREIPLPGFYASTWFRENGKMIVKKLSSSRISGYLRNSNYSWSRRPILHAHEPNIGRKREREERARKEMATTQHAARKRKKNSLIFTSLFFVPLCFCKKKLDPSSPFSKHFIPFLTGQQCREAWWQLIWDGRDMQAKQMLTCGHYHPMWDMRGRRNFLKNFNFPLLPPPSGGEAVLNYSTGALSRTCN